MNNAPRFPGNYGNGLQEGYSTYKFALVMENSVEIDWVTEKFFLPFQANTVPVYYGAPNIAKYAPGPNSFINMRDFDSPGALLERLLPRAQPVRLRLGRLGALPAGRLRKVAGEAEDA